MPSTATSWKTLVLVVVTLLAGCAPVVRSVASEVPEPLIHGSLRTLAQEDTRALAAEVFSTPEVRDATRRLVATLADGALDALTEEERAERLAAMMSELAQSIVTAVAAALDRELAPVVISTARRTVDATTREILSPANADRLAIGLSDISDRVIRSAAGSMRAEVGPALRDILSDPETQEVLRATVRGVAAESVRGTTIALRNQHEEAGEDGFVRSVERAVRRSAQLLDLIALGTVLAVVALAVWMARRSRRVAVRDALAQRREVVTLALLARAAHRSEELPPELRRALERVLRETEAEASARPRSWWWPAAPRRDRPA